MISLPRWLLALLLLPGIVFLTIDRALPIMVVALLLIVFSRPQILKPFRYIRFWILYLTILFIFPFLTTATDAHFLGIPYNSIRMATTVVMCLRGILVFLLVQVFTHDLNAIQVQNGLSKLGLKSLDGVISTAEELIPRVRSIILARIAQYKRQSRHSNPVKTIYNLLLNLLLDMQELADREKPEKSISTERVVPQLLEILEKSPKILIICGGEKAGKTSLMQSLISEMIMQSEDVGGILSISRQAVSGWVIHLTDIRSGADQELATQAAFETEVCMGKYFFHTHTIDLGNHILEREKDAAYVVLDEFGYLELSGKGFWPGFTYWIKYGQGTMIITVRNTLKEALREILDDQMSINEQLMWYEL